MVSFILLASVGLAQKGGSLPPLKVVGKNLVDPKGKIVQLKGCNLGSWFVIEPWINAMAAGEGKIEDQYELEQTLTQRFGKGESNRLMDAYRESWITERDMKLIPTFGFNCVRLPLNYRQFEDDSNPYKLKSDAWKWCDRAIAMAEKQGLYVILDMHGVQGGQSGEMHTGRAGQNALWKDPENPKRLAWLWGEMAKRYKNRSAVVAYDVFNEPYGGTHELEKPIFQKCYESIRKYDPEKLIYAMGHYDTYTFYGSNKENGWKNVGYQMHYYPGLFGGGEPNLRTHARHIASLQATAKHIDGWNSPFLVGEMNVVFDSAGGAGMMRRYFDLHAKYGWATTMWCYKTYSREGGIADACWGMAVNKNKFTPVDVKTASKTEIEKFFRSFATHELQINTKLREALTSKNPKLPALPEIPAPITKAPADQKLSGWTSTDVGEAMTGGLLLGKDGQFTLYGSGADIWGAKDSFRYLHRKAEGDFELEVQILDVADVHQYTKAGVMVRSGLDNNAPFVLLSTFPGGEAQMAVRKSAGTDAQSPFPTNKMSFPLWMRIERRGSTVTAFVGQPGDWKKAGETEFVSGPVEAGVVALSHDEGQLTKILYSNLSLK